MFLADVFDLTVARASLLHAQLARQLLFVVCNEFIHTHNSNHFQHKQQEDLQTSQLI